ncbi:MAG: non-homologous end-joining DNA ligase [Gaiellaceae bacterium]
MTSVDIEGRRLRLTNLDKVLWPEAGRTKAWLIEYYTRIAPVLLPHLECRPLTLRRFPDGVDGVSWHQNECRGEPDWFHVLETAGKGGRILRFCVVDDLPSLIWVANQGTLEVHPFQWRVDEPRRPATLVFDLDPGPPAGLQECARVALLLRDVLDELGLASFVKTSGSRGLHLHVPLGTPHDGDQVKRFARAVAEALAQAHPDDVIAEVDKSRRAGKVFLDWLQNDPTRQTVAPYSLRGLPWPTVATPVTWDEVERGEALVFLGEDVLDRVERIGDVFGDVLNAEQALPAL